MKFASPQKNVVKTAFSGAVLLSVVVGFICFSFIQTLPAHAAMDMSTMPSHAVHAKSASNCCEADATNHMELWKSTFDAIPQSLQQFLALVAIAIFATLTFKDFFSTARPDINFLYTRFRQYARAHPDIQTYNALRLAFARGILHPKTF